MEVSLQDLKYQITYKCIVINDNTYTPKYHYECHKKKNMKFEAKE